MRKPDWIFITVVCALLAACGYDDFGEYKPEEKVPLTPNMDIGDMKALYGGMPLNIYDNIIIAGYVTANDYSGNFYRTFIIEDHTGAVEVKAGIYNLHNTFTSGRYVAVKAKGLTVGAYDGVLQIGLPPSESGGFQTDYFGYRHVMDDYVLPCDLRMEVMPMELKAGELDEALCGRLVRVGGVSFVPDEDDETDTWAVPAGDGVHETRYRMFESDAGVRLAVVTSGYADFAGEPIPTGVVAVTGILMYGKTDTGKAMFMIKMRNSKDAGID